MIKFNDPQKGFDGNLTYSLTDNKKEVIIVNIIIDRSDINKFMQILSSQGKLKKDEIISVECMELSNNKTEDISADNIFQGDFTCSLNDGKDNIFKGNIKLDVVSFNLDAAQMKKIDDAYTNILNAKMIIHPGECRLLRF